LSLTGHLRMVCPMQDAPQTVGVVPELDLQLRLYVARRHARMEQEQLAEALGVSPKTVGRYERGETTPPKHLLMAWALATGVDVNWLQGDYVKVRHRRSSRTVLTVPLRYKEQRALRAWRGSRRPVRLDRRRNVRAARPMSEVA
jgi:transcriptional regulator with XRE-family HTH domain